MLGDASGSKTDVVEQTAAPKAKAPAKPRAPAKPKSTAAKPAAKGAAKGKKKVLAERDDNAEDESDIDVVMADPDEVNEADGVDPTSSKKNKSASETYQKVRTTTCAARPIADPVPFVSSHNSSTF